MRQISAGYRRMGVLIDVNSDRLLFSGAIIMALFTAAFITSF